MTDQPFVALMLDAADDGRARLILRCRRNRTEALIVAQQFIGAGREMGVMTRVADRPAVSQQWLVSTDGTAVFAPSPVEFIRAVLAGNVLRAEIQPRTSARMDLRFETRGLSEVIGPLQAACGWR